jgi:nicotinate-nucleotide adenylyltransferase
VRTNPGVKTNPAAKTGPGSKTGPAHVALFGGSFNPPHVAHQMVALYVLETQPVDQVWFVPTFRHAFHKPLAPFDNRVRMCELATKVLGRRGRVTEIERVIGGPSRTLNTVRRLCTMHPGNKFSIVIGSDLEAELPAWYGIGKLQQLAEFIIIGRRASLGAAAHSAVTMPEVSSTEVRGLLRAGKSPEGLVPRAVLDYIYRHGLYREPA